MNSADSEPLRASVPSCEDIRDLMLLDALGETTPEQKATLSIHLQEDPDLAAEHADLTLLSSTLAMNTPAIPSMPEHVLEKLSAQLSPPSRSTAWQHLAKPLAIAACLTVLAAMGGWWLKDEAQTPFLAQNEPVSAEDQPAPLSVVVLSKPTPGAGGGTRRALLVAVEPWPDKEKNPERGAGWRDLEMMREVLIKKWGFSDSNVHQLFNKEATTRNAVQALEKLAAETQPGDSVVIYWTSHGTQVADTNGDEPDGLDEAYCTFDYNWAKPETWFTDDLFHALLARLQTKDILVITDACHSGGSTRGEEDSDILPKAISSGFVPAATPNPKAVPVTAPSHVMHLAACAADEVSYGGYGKGGFFTIQLHQAFLNASPDSINFQQAVDRVRPKLSTLFKGFKLKADDPKTWTPQFEGPVTKKISTFLNPPAAPPAPPTPPPPPLPTWQSQSGDIALHLTTDKTIYTEGDLMQVTVTPDLDCHLRLYYLSADHKVHQIFPNQFQTESLVKKGQPITLPGAAGTFEFRMSAPYGNEILLAVASDVPFTDQSGEDLKTQLFKEFKDTNLETLAHRGITVGEKKALTGRALHLYRVEAKK